MLDIIIVADRSNLSHYLFKRNERQRPRVIGLQDDMTKFYFERTRAQNIASKLKWDGKIILSFR